jgi:hypothetical protein
MPNFTPLVIVWGILATVVVVLVFIRREAGVHEDDSIHLSGGADADREQAKIVSRLAKIDFWLKTLGAILLVSGLGMACVYTWIMFTNPPSPFN